MWKKSDFKNVSFRFIRTQTDWKVPKNENIQIYKFSA
jgi:hypothetical protein